MILSRLLKIQGSFFVLSILLFLLFKEYRLFFSSFSLGILLFFLNLLWFRLAASRFKFFSGIWIWVKYPFWAAYLYGVFSLPGFHGLGFFTGCLVFMLTMVVVLVWKPEGV